MIRALALAAALMTYGGLSHAALGQAPIKLDSPVAASVLTTAKSTHTEIETVLDSGTRIREYVGTDGKVFAVTWNGPFLPNLRSLLGTYFDTMTAESAKTPKAGHSQLRINTPEVVILSGGRMRAFNGRAWVPAQLPAGVNVEDIK
jgi:hypothetical protein